MIKIRAVIEHITFQNSENGYSIMKAKVKEHPDLVTLICIIPLHESKPYEFPEETNYPMVAESEIEYKV